MSSEIPFVDTHFEEVGPVGQGLLRNQAPRSDPNPLEGSWVSNLEVLREQSCLERLGGQEIHQEPS